MTVNQALGEIVKATNLAPIEKAFKTIDKNTLVIFDVDHVLIMPEAAYSLNRYPHRKKLWLEMQKTLSKEEIRLLHSIVTASAKWHLVDPKILTLLNSLKMNHIPTLALTSVGTGKLGVIDKREDLRVKELNSVEIDFEKLSPLQGEIHLNHYSGENGFPILKKGIIFTAEFNKGEVLKDILHKKRYYPRSIIFIDDQRSNLESLKKICTKLKIRFTGFHYTAASFIVPPPLSGDFEAQRLKILQTEHRWVTRLGEAEKVSTKPLPSKKAR